MHGESVDTICEICGLFISGMWSRAPWHSSFQLHLDPIYWGFIGYRGRLSINHQWVTLFPLSLSQIRSGFTVTSSPTLTPCYYWMTTWNRYPVTCVTECSSGKPPTTDICMRYRCSFSLIHPHTPQNYHTTNSSHNQFFTPSHSLPSFSNTTPFFEGSRPRG